MRALAVLGVLALLAGGASARRPSKPKQICGLRLPCKGTTVHGSHDLYGALKKGAEQGQPLLLSTSKRGCLHCEDPARLFDAIAKDPGRNGGVLTHIYFALGEVARRAFARSRPKSIDAVLGTLHSWCDRSLREAREKPEPVGCDLLTAHCASSPGFATAFVAFAAKALWRAPADSDPGFVKERTVKLALFANPPGALPVVIRFIRSKARVRARMKAVRDICGYAAVSVEAKQALQWVQHNDPDLAPRAVKCLKRLGPTAP